MNITGIISAIIIGAIIGALGRLLLPGRQPIGVLLTVLVGIVAAIVGTAIAQRVGVATTSGIDWIELAFQVGLA
ncbi:GlsB/YeaQ/YmgE family stress response membrane protein, partial [Actinomadura geliboluensis]